MTDTLTRIATLAGDITRHHLRPDQITAPTRIADWSTDSLDQIELFVSIEGEFCIDLDEPAIDLAGTFGELAKAVDVELNLMKGRAA